jgi:hypothetical protein
MTMIEREQKRDEFSFSHWTGEQIHAHHRQPRPFFSAMAHAILTVRDLAESNALRSASIRSSSCR